MGKITMIAVLITSVAAYGYPKLEKPAEVNAVAEQEQAESTTKNTPTNAGSTTTPAAPKEVFCSEAEALKGVQMLQSASIQADMLPVFALGGLALACEKHKGVTDVVKVLTATRIEREAKRRHYANGVWAHMHLFERGCKGGTTLLSEIGLANISGTKAQRVIAQHCRFVEQNLISKGEVPTLDNGYAPLIPIFQALMTASKVKPSIQRILLRGTLGLKTAMVPAE